MKNPGSKQASRHSKDAVNAVPERNLNKAKKSKGSLIDFFRKSPLYGVELDLTRSKETGRKVEFTRV